MSKSILQRLHLLYIYRPFSSFPSPSKGLSENSFTVNYLINSCGLTPGKAASVSKHLKIKSADRADSVLTFFKDQGFTPTQISKVVYRSPRLLILSPEKNFLPKLEFLKSKGISGTKFVAVISKVPDILSRSLENYLIPCYVFLNDFLQDEQRAAAAFKRCLNFYISGFERHIKPNIEILKQAGVPVRNIRFLMTNNPHVLLSSCNKCHRIVDEVKKMGFDPLKVVFLTAAHALACMTKSTWNRKVEVYKGWGWSENDILSAFRKTPNCMSLSEDKINSMMDFLVNKMGLKSSFLVERPHILIYSSEKRIVPRCLVYQALASKGLIKPSETRLTTTITYPEKYFLERIIGCHVHEAPEILKLYKQKLEISK